MAKIKITQVRSKIGSDWTQVATLTALGIKKLNRAVIHEVTPQIILLKLKKFKLIKIKKYGFK